MSSQRDGGRGRSWTDGAAATAWLKPNRPNAETHSGDCVSLGRVMRTAAAGVALCLHAGAAEAQSVDVLTSARVAATSGHRAEALTDLEEHLSESPRDVDARLLYGLVLQVPLIVHVPTALRQRFESAPDALAFTSDITPTLYTLLGHDVAASSPAFGRPLFQRRGTAPPARALFGLVASSYGNVYGWLDGAGRDLYIADGINLRDYAYRLDGSAAGAQRTMTPEVRAAGQRAIRQGIGAIADVYKFTPPQY